MLDCGAGPGVSSRMMIEYGFEDIVGLDPSKTLLGDARRRLGPEFNPIVGVAENLPIQDNRIRGIITCFSLRDVRDLSKSIAEFARVAQENGRLEIVDIGKPDGLVPRRLISLYIITVMPTVARLWIGRRSRKNPFKMIIPTFQRLPTNHRLKRLVEQGFGNSRLEEIILGGLITLGAERKIPADEILT